MGVFENLVSEECDKKGTPNTWSKSRVVCLDAQTMSLEIAFVLSGGFEVYCFVYTKLICIFVGLYCSFCNLYK